MTWFSLEEYCYSTAGLISPAFHITVYHGAGLHGPLPGVQTDGLLYLRLFDTESKLTKPLEIYVPRTQKKKLVTREIRLTQDNHENSRLSLLRRIKALHCGYGKGC